MSKRAQVSPLLLALTVLLVACSRDGEVRRYQEVSIEAPRAAPPAGGMGGQGAMQGQVPTAALKLAWDTPAGWTEKAGGSMRLATFLVDGAECAVSAFPGNTGGLEANLRRWLGQIDAEGTDEQIAGLIQRAQSFMTKAGWAGQSFDLTAALPDGSANGMRAAIIPVEGQSVFVKLMGPAEVLEKQRGAFDALCQSLRPAEGAAAPAAAPAATPAAAPAMTGEVPTAALALAWQAPVGWTEKAGGSMRLATFAVEGAECSVSAFPGDTGGEQANLRRWFGQLQVQASDAQLAQTAAGAVAFQTAGGWAGKLFDLTKALPAGAASGMRAAIIPVDGQTVFVKFTGPPAVLDAQADALAAFCRSLKRR